MTAFDYLLLFGSAFINVFLLGLQSRNVNAGRYTAAVITSFGISCAQFLFVKYAAAGAWSVFGTSAAGGCLGIAASIWFYGRFMHKPKKTAAEMHSEMYEDETARAIATLNSQPSEATLAFYESLNIKQRQMRQGAPT